MKTIKDIKIIALDIDGTLLTTDKRLTDRNRTALQNASDRGIHIVPVTGRVYRGLPQAILALPFLRYAITANGASVYDIGHDSILYRAEMTVSQAVQIMSWLDGQSVIYDCYMDGTGWMSEAMLDRIELYAPNPNLVSYLRSIRTPVPDLKAFLTDRGTSIQKMHVFCRDKETQRYLLRHLPFTHVAVSSSAERNVEINHEDADKGIALLALADHLRIDRDQVMAFGDGLNDIPMIRAAGIGVVMGNAADEVKAAGDMITADNDRDGVAEIIEALIASEK